MYSNVSTVEGVSNVSIGSVGSVGRVSVGRQSLVKALEACSRVVPAKTDIPSLRYVKLDCVDKVLTATDLAISVRASVDLEADQNNLVIAAIAMPCKDMLLYLKALKTDVVTMDVTAGQVTVSEIGETFMLGDTDDFPRLPAKSSVLCKMSKEDFYNLFNSVSFAALPYNAPTTQSNYQYVTVAKDCLVIIDSQKITAVASDNHILAANSLEKFTDTDDSKQYLFYAQAVNIALKILKKSNVDTVTLWLCGDTHIAIEIGDIEILSVLIDEPYPSWQALFPQDLPCSVNFDRDEAVKALKALETANSHDSVVALSCDSDSNKMTIKTSKGTADIFARANGAFVISFNMGDLLDILEHIPEHIDASGITLKANPRPNIAAHITAQNCLCRYNYLIMPLRFTA